MKHTLQIVPMSVLHQFHLKLPSISMRMKPSPRTQMQARLTKGYSQVELQGFHYAIQRLNDTDETETEHNERMTKLPMIYQILI